MEEKPKTKRPKVPKLKTDSEPKTDQVESSIIEYIYKRVKTSCPSCYFEMIYIGS